MPRRWFALLWCLAACEYPHPMGLDDATEFTAPAVYAEWWIAVNECVAPSLFDMSNIRWFLVANFTGVPGAPETQPNGAWAAPHTIYLTPEGRERRGTVQHEMLHDMVQSVSHTHHCFQRF